jgi:hypothetical protein
MGKRKKIKRPVKKIAITPPNSQVLIGGFVNKKKRLSNSKKRRKRALLHEAFFSFSMKLKMANRRKNAIKQRNAISPDIIQAFMP